MRILLTGGGTGGHITPLIAVARELKRLDPSCQITYVGERHGQFMQLIHDNSDFDAVRTIFAGKLRRYHGEKWYQRLFDVKTNLLNLRDIFYIIFGVIQSLLLVRLINPDVIFLKGGFVGVPVGLAGALWRVPFVTHDSDAMPGLANRVIGRWAAVHATGMPSEFYTYPIDKSVYVGVIVGEDFQAVTSSLQKTYRRSLNLPEQARILLVTGGSLGAQRLNASVAKLMPQLLNDFSDLLVIHQVGKGKAAVYGDFVHDRLHVLEFMQPMYQYTGAADVVVTRAGANTLAELGVQGKACVIVPNPTLTGGHQLKNAENLVRQDAVLVVEETSFRQGPEMLSRMIRTVLLDEKKRIELAKKLQNITIPDAAQKVAHLLIEVANRRRE